MTRVLITCPQMQNDFGLYEQAFRQRNIEVDLPPITQQATKDQLLEIIDRYDGMIAGDDPIDSDVLSRAARMRVIAKWGVGVDSIDLAAAETRGIAVLNTPGEFADEVADVAIGYMIMLTRQLHKIDAGIREGAWPKPVGTSLRGKVLGVVGLGAIGSAVAARGTVMGMSVVGCDPSPEARARAAAAGVHPMSFDELSGSAEVISLNCPLTKETFHLLDPAAFDRMKEGTILVNVARGQLIDEPALVAALESGRVSGAALDVFEVEPLPPGARLRGFAQCIFGSHNASNTAEASRKVSERSVGNLLKGLDLA